MYFVDSTIGINILDSIRQVERRVTFAVPFEVIWLTPLHSWNPYNIPKKSSADISGKGSQTDPYNGIGDKEYFMTPNEFFTGSFEQGDAADTVSGGVHVQTPSHGVRVTHASGVRILFPEIAGIEGRIRQRYPIMPIHGEGSALWKKLNALEDAMEFAKAANISSSARFQTGLSHSASTQQTGHRHQFRAADQDLADIRSGVLSEISVQTETANGHFHSLVVRRKAGTANGATDEFFIASCDNQDDAAANAVCFDHHANTVTEVNGGI